MGAFMRGIIRDLTVEKVHLVEYDFERCILLNEEEYREISFSFQSDISPSFNIPIPKRSS